jgi:hypothetical protein
MDAPQPAPPGRLAFALQTLRSPQGLATIAGGALLGVAIFAATYFVFLKPARDLAQRRYDAQMAMLELYDLQIAHKRAAGAYANDLGALLRLSPGGAALKAKLNATTDPATLTVVGDAEKFKLEANVRDAERTLIKIKGPLGAR